MLSFRSLKLLALLGLCLHFAGCASSKYQYGPEPSESHLSPPKPQQIYVGKPNKFLDASDWIWPGSLLAKLILWNKNVDSHQISEETILAIAEYVEKNNLDDVLILVNTYKPGAQWYRLFRNKQVGAGWRYTFGIISVASYTAFPGRFFGGDHFNPYTNTISLYSDDIAIALHEAAHAKDFSRRKHKGMHAALYALPGAALYYEAVASSDALSYLQRECKFKDEKHAYRALHPAYGTYVGGTFLRTSGIGFLGALPGHITGNVAALFVDEDEDREDPPCPIDIKMQPIMDGENANNINSSNRVNTNNSETSTFETTSLEPINSTPSE